MFFPEDRYYTKKHHWVKTKDNIAQIGLTAYVEHQAGTVSFFDFPAPGEKIESGAPLFKMETIKAAVEIDSPLTGRVIRANPEIASNPQLFNLEPFTHWLVELTMEKKNELSGFINLREYEEFLKNLT